MTRLAWLGLALLLASAHAASAEPLVYCGDQEGGGPYIYPSPDDPHTVIGTDVDIAAALARHLGREARFQQGQWDRLPDLLGARKCDVVINGYERTPSRVATMAASLPYQVYGLAFLVRKDRDPTFGLETLKGEGRFHVGALTGSSAEAWLRANVGPNVVIATYDGNTDAMREVETKKLDGTLQDTPIATFYAPRFPELEARGEPVGHGYYVVYARSDDRALIEGIDHALLEMIQSGELRAILHRYGVWDAPQKELLEIAAHAPLFGVVTATVALVESSSVASASPLGARPRGLFEVARRYGAILIESAGLTVLLSVISFPIAVLLGLMIAVGRIWGPRVLAVPLTLYVEVLRGTPLMLQLYFVFFFLPELGVNIPAFGTAILGLAVNYSAYESEIYRAGLQAVPRGQMEAALSLGLSRSQALSRVVIPQAFRSVIPPVMNDFIALFKDTSVCSVVTLIELTKRFSVLSQSTQATIELMVLTALLYLAMSWPASKAARMLEHRLGVETRG